MVNLAVNGALGRMGRRILTLAAQSDQFKIVGAFEYPKHPDLGRALGDLLGLATLKLALEALTEKNLKKADVLIDFSGPEGADECIRIASKTGKGLVIGSTGLGVQTEKKIRVASSLIPILDSPNMSLGANFLFELAREAAAKLKDGYDIEIIEAHHRLKKDAPSGTAKKIAEVIAKEKGWNLEKASRYGRKGLTGERTRDEIGIHVVRAGDIVGEHTVIFGGPGETIELKHTALSRDAFARGALVAALFVSTKSKGRFSMENILK